MEARISSSTMDNTNKIKTSVTLFLLYGVCLFPAYYGDLYALLGIFAFSTLLPFTTWGFMPKRFIVDGGKANNRYALPEILYPHRRDHFGTGSRPIGFRSRDPFVRLQLVVWLSWIFLFYHYRTCEGLCPSFQ